MISRLSRPITDGGYAIIFIIGPIFSPAFARLRYAAPGFISQPKTAWGFDD